MADDHEVEQYHEEVRKLRGELEVLRGGGGEQPKPRPLRQADILAALLYKHATSGGEHSTVKLGRNAKGDTQVEVSVRTGESAEVATVEQAAAKAREVYDALRMVYPPPSPGSSS